MIVWLNGAFGAGKTTAACELHRRLEHSFVYDPENIGYFLRKNMPQECHTDDFQDMTLWRSFNYQILKDIHAAYGGAVIVPMTLVDPAYYEEIIRRLRNEGVPVCHVILYAGRETILKRLNKRSLGRLDKESFAVDAIDRCLAFFNGPADGIRIETDNIPVEKVVEKIGEVCGLPILPDQKSKFGREAARLKTMIRHIRH